MKHHKNHKDEVVIYLERVIAGGLVLIAAMGLVNIVQLIV